MYSSMAFSNVITKLSIGVFSVTFICFLLESILYQGLVENKLGIPLLFIALLSILFASIMRFSRKIPAQWSAILFISTTVILIIGGIGSLLDLNVYPNYFYSLIHINPLSLFPFGCFLAILSIVTLQKESFKKNSRLLLFLIPFWLFPLFYYFKYYNDELFHSLAREDSLFEYSTMFGYLTSSIVMILSFRIIFQAKKTKQYPWLIYLFTLGFVAFAMFVIAGEEISWGQRIIGFETPEDVAANNNQLEFNIHNSGQVQPLVFYAYTIITLYCMSAFAIVTALRPIFRNKSAYRFFHLFAPSPLLIAFFIPMLFLGLAKILIGDTYNIVRWEETIELFLSLGIMTFLIMVYKQLLHNKKDLSKIL